MLLAIPDGEERRAREFYVDVLGLIEVIRPEALGGNAGGWFQGGPVMVHLDVDPDFHAARKAHPAILVTDLGFLTARCEAAGHRVKHGVKLPGFDRIHVCDPFGNRLEFMQIDRAMP
ncbi:MAG: VOC family protein [Gemmatimonadaceae bacterium]